MAPDTGVPVVEYGSLTCPHCATFAAEVLPKLKKAYIDTGKVHFIFREFSRNPLDVAALHAGALRRRRQGAGGDRPAVRRAGQMGVRRQAARAPHRRDAPDGPFPRQGDRCLKDNSKAQALQNIAKTATDLVKLQGTPTFIIDGKVYGGELTYDQLEAILKPLVK